MSFKRLEAEDFVVSSDAITSTLWSQDKPELTNEFFTSPSQQSELSGNFYLSVFNKDPEIDPTAEVQFSIAYANKNGGGSTPYNGTIPENTPTRTTYGQYRSLILEDEDANFVFGTGNNQVELDYFYVISIERARYKESLFLGSFNLTLAGNSDTVTLTDNSKDSTIAQYMGTTRVFQIVEGTNGEESTPISSGFGSYGLIFPDLGLIFLNPNALNNRIGLNLNNSIGVSNLTNQLDLYNVIVNGESFKLNSKETISSNYIFVRSRNSEFNYTENPTFIKNNGEVIYSNYINNPQTYVTSVGFYNDENELLAVAKLSRPLLKDFTKESLIRVKLDF